MSDREWAATLERAEGLSARELLEAAADNERPLLASIAGRALARRDGAAAPPPAPEPPAPAKPQRRRRRTSVQNS